jgi:hypothetical protein
MPGLRELLAVVLGVLLGIGLLAAPRTALRLSVFVGPTRRRRGDYGTDDAIPDQWTWIVRGLGVASLAVATFIAYQTYT